MENIIFNQFFQKLLIRQSQVYYIIEFLRAWKGAQIF